MKNHRIMSKGDNEMGLFLKSYKIAYITSVGELNEAKINRLKYFKERYPVIARQQGGPGVLLLNPINSCSIVLLPNRIVLDYNGENLNINRQQVQKDFEELVDKLILESTGAVTFHYIANLEDKNKDSMRTSLKNMQRYELKNVVGLGARFLYNFDDDFWEFKVEPLIKNPRYFFIEAICNYSSISIDQITNLLDDTYNFYMECVKEHCDI